MIISRIAPAMFLLLLGCGLIKQQEVTKVSRNGINMLYGEISRQDLFREYPDWEVNYQSFDPNPEIITQLSGITRAVRVEIFLGTWCGDSRREVPRFLKIVDQSRFMDPDQIRMWAVDRKKQLENNLAAGRNIERVATFIFFEGNAEIGRIIERPVSQDLAAEILQILRSE